jgi:predicted MFS family arabinose efflux permease
MTGIGAVGAFAVSAASYLPFILVVLWILPRRPLQAEQGEGFDRHRLRVNVGIVLSQPLLRGALATVFVTSLLCAPVVVFCPLLVKEAFHGDVSHFSLAVGAFGVGGLLGGIGLLGATARKDLRPLSSGFAALYGVVVIAAGWSGNPWGLSLLFVLAGISMTVSNTSANVVLQSSANDNVRGQTVSLYMLAMRGGMALGSLLTGLSVGAVGIRVALSINGALAVLLHLVLARLWSRASAIPRQTS